MKTFNESKIDLITSRKLLRKIKIEKQLDKEITEYLYGKTPMFAPEPQRLILIDSEESRLKDLIYISKSRMRRITRRQRKSVA